ncbi:glycosyltransferase family 4 protein [Neobacillus drentensis]|uniref:glycosyltransferase family 4 protein n=1 Tax=Neobacillus drentensis TaxID=220684 RepID=UPI002FFDA42E
MHILIPIFFNAPLGGLHLNAMSTALHCKKNGHDVTVVCKKGIFTEKLRKANINIINTNFNDSEYPLTVNKILELNRTKKIDIIHSHPFQSRKLTILLSRILDVPFFVTIHGRHTDNIETYIDKVEMVFTVSEGVKDFVKEHLTKKGLRKYFYKLLVVPNGVDMELFKRVNNSRFIDNTERFKISLVSRLDKDKEFIIDIFYKALRFAKNNFSQKVYWTIVGDGTLKEEMQRKVKEINNGDFVKFVGWKENNELLMEYIDSDVIIAPGRSALEGMSCGKPVIAIGSKAYIGLIDKENWLKGVYANFGGIGNKIEDYIEGSIENDIKRVIEDGLLRQELEELGPNLISQFYKEEEANSNLLRFFQMIRSNITKQKETNQEDLSEQISSYLIETNIKNTLLTQLTNKEIKIEVVCHDYENIEFAWYIFKENNVIQKIYYSSSNSINYKFNEPGKYRIRCFLRKEQASFSFLTKVINVKI